MGQNNVSSLPLFTESGKKKGSNHVVKTERNNCKMSSRESKGREERGKTIKTSQVILSLILREQSQVGIEPGGNQML